MNPKEVVMKFNECINFRNIKKIAKYMHEDYRFIDSAGNIKTGKAVGLEDWKSFFSQFPDYRNIFEHMREKKGFVIVVGRSECSVEGLNGPAIWVAQVVDNTIKEWRVFEDTPEVRKKWEIK